MSDAKYQREWKLKKKLTHSYNRGDRKAQKARERKKYPHQVAAYQKVFHALKRKKLIRPLNCSLCNERGYIMGHHSDYSKPLDVIWVCWKCHEMLHSHTTNKRR